ncbi:MAG TPA: uracil-DNA glycosylase [bacterium]|nr:uracil-DNA glycosylase [bacterium]
MSTERALARLAATITVCRLCPRLVRYREAVARAKKREFAHWTYWGRPVPGMGDPRAELLVVGLAPAAHGANRTGRMFTGDASGQWLMRAMHRQGFASQPTSVHRDDGLRLTRAFITATVRCAPPDNKPLPAEIARCARYLRAELDLLPRVRVVVALGQIAFLQVLRHARERGFAIPRPRPAFAHGARFTLRDGAGRRLELLASYHPSRQNTQTGRLTAAMLDAVFRRARRLLDRAGG